LESRKRVADAGVVLLLSPSQNHRNAASPLARGDLPQAVGDRKTRKRTAAISPRAPSAGFVNILRASVPSYRRSRGPARQKPAV
jgi:hypothetical protein